LIACRRIDYRIIDFGLFSDDLLLYALLNVGAGGMMTTGACATGSSTGSGTSEQADRAREEKTAAVSSLNDVRI